MSEALKEEAKGRFQRADFMGAAKVRYGVISHAGSNASHIVTDDLCDLFPLQFMI